MQISADLSSMSHDQREALSKFVLTYPVVDAVGMVVEPKPRWATRTVVLSAEVELSPEAVRKAPKELSPEDAFSCADVAATDDIPAPPAAPAAVAGNSLDKSGLPWDERIHSSSKNLTADGLWRKKRGVDDALIAQVEGQLKALMSAPSQTVPAATVSGPDPVPAAPIPPPPPPSTPIAIVPSQEVMDARQAYIKLVGRASTAMQEQKLSQAELQEILTKYGVPTLPLLMTARPDLIPNVAMDIEALVVTR